MSPQDQARFDYLRTQFGLSESAAHDVMEAIGHSGNARTRAYRACKALANQMVEPPGADRMRNVLGGGSGSDINAGIQQFKQERREQQAQDLPRGLPVFFVESMQQVMDMLRDEARDELNAHRAEVDTQISQRDGEIERLRGELAVAQGQADASLAKINLLEDRAAHLERLLDTEREARKIAEQHTQDLRLDNERQRQDMLELGAQMELREASHRLELDRRQDEAEERLRGVEKHTLAQVTEARLERDRAIDDTKKAYEERIAIAASAHKRDMDAEKARGDRIQSELSAVSAELKSARVRIDELLQRAFASEGQVSALQGVVQQLQSKD